jgi:hypothetical protein
MAGTKVTPFHFDHLECTTCHEDIHHGQFSSRMAARDASGRVLGCQACHSTTGWKDLKSFNHAQTAFPLVGSHRAVACAECHKPPNMELSMRRVDFTKAPVDCGDCHQNPHANQFGSRQNDCAGCHNTNKWKPSLFDHKTTGFPLSGGHEDVACAACHTLKKPVDGNLVLFYKATPKACGDCHQSSIPQPSKHSF